MILWISPCSQYDFRDGTAVDQTSSYFIINNAVSSFSLHHIEDGICIRSYHTKPKKAYPKQVTFAERGKIVVGGGEGGAVHIFDKNTGRHVQILRHSTAGRVQTITVRFVPQGVKETTHVRLEAHEDANSCLIILTSSSNEKDINILLWRKDLVSAAEGPMWSNNWSSIRILLQVTTHLVTLVAVMALVLQTMVSAHSIMTISRSPRSIRTHIFLEKKRVI